MGQEAGSAGGVVAEEACRTADRLDELARVIEGRGVLGLLSFRLGLDLEDELGDRHVDVKVEFSNVLAEARQQQLALKNLLSHPGLQGKAGSKPATVKGRGSALDELAKRRADRVPGS